MSINLNFPSPDNYDEWDAWGRAMLRALNTLIAALGVVDDVGKIVSFPVNISPPPTGYLLCNGATFLRASYPALAQMLNSTTLPNLASPFGAGYSVWIKAA